MKDFSKIAELLNRLPFDIRFEVVAADLIEQGIRPDQLIAWPKSIFKRRFSKDINSVWSEKNNIGIEELHFELNRDGVYDILPEGVFHQRKSKRNGQNKGEVIADVKQARAEKESARLFFEPMENEVLHLRIQIERAERKLFLDFEQSETNDLMINFWNLEEYREYPSIPFLIRLLPIMFRISGKLDLVKTCYELLLGVPIKIKMTHDSDTWNMPMSGWQLSAHALGLETVLSSSLPDDLPSYQIEIGPLHASEIPNFLSQGKTTKYLHLLNSYFLVAGCEVKFSILPYEDEKKPLPISENSFLGVNVYL